MKYDYPSLIADLIVIESPELIKLILEFANTAERENIILSDEIKRTCQCLIYGNRLGTLKLFVQQCLSSKDILVKFKEMMKKMKDTEENMLVLFCQYKLTLQEEKGTWTELFQLLDNLIQKIDKRRNL